jgi:hypothetical protein
LMQHLGIGRVGWFVHECSTCVDNSLNGLFLFKNNNDQNSTIKAMQQSLAPSIALIIKSSTASCTGTAIELSNAVTERSTTFAVSNSTT